MAAAAASSSAAPAGGGGDLTYGAIALATRGRPNPGKLRLQSSAGLLAWRSDKTSRVVSLPAADMASCEWIRVHPAGNGHRLRIRTKAGALVRLDGFRETDKADVAAFIKGVTGDRLSLADRAVDTKGRNWGDLELSGANVSFSHEKLGDGFDVPLGEVAQVVLQSKNELALELNLDDHAVTKDDLTLTEIRFYVPTGVDADNTQAMSLRDEIVSRAGLGDNEGEEIASFPETLMLVPRGRFRVDVLPRALKVSGKTYDYKLNFSAFTGLFALPNPDQRQVYFVIGLDPPIRQGQTSYPHLVAQFPSDAESVDHELNLDDSLLKDHPKLARTMNGPPLKVLSRLVRAFSDKTIQRPGPFESHRHTPTIRCSNRANDGRLYILDDAFFFVPKPVHVPFDDISSLEFARASLGQLSGRTFDLHLNRTDGTTAAFKSIPKEEFDPLFGFVEKIAKQRGISIKNVRDAREMREAMVTGKKGLALPDDMGGDSDSDGSRNAGGGGDSDEDDDDFHAESDDMADADGDGSEDGSGGSDDDAASGGGTEGKKRKGGGEDRRKKKKKKKRRRRSGDEDE